MAKTTYSMSGLLVELKKSGITWSRTRLNAKILKMGLATGGKETEKKSFITVSREDGDKLIAEVVEEHNKKNPPPAEPPAIEPQASLPLEDDFSTLAARVQRVEETLAKFMSALGSV